MKFSEADVIIVGCGVAGAAVAYGLSGRHQNILVLDEVRKVMKNDDLREYIKIIEKNSSSGEDCLEMAAALLKMVRQN